MRGFFYAKKFEALLQLWYYHNWNILSKLFFLEITLQFRYNTSVMIISFEASANVDTTLFGYFCMRYDEDFLNAIKENLTEINKDGMLSFSCDLDSIKLVYGEYTTARRTIKISDIEANKFTTVFNGKFDHVLTKRFESVKLNIDKDYFYFTGLYIAKGRKLIEFQSLNFDARFIDSIHKAYSKQEFVVN